MIDQTAYWNGPAGERWVREQELLDVMLRPFGDAALEAASVKAGEAVLDVGCGCGETSVLLAGRVGAAGRVVGVDISVPMLGRARGRRAGANVTFTEADASAAALGDGAFNLVFSRFGVMFFRDPVAAFANLHGALRPGGRLAFVCWGPHAQNPWSTVPLEAAAGVVGPPDPQPPDAPGPFAFGDASRVTDILRRAGFDDVRAKPQAGVMRFGRDGSLDEAVVEISRVGTVARLLVDRDNATVAAVHAAVRAALPPHLGKDGACTFSASVWIVTARRSPAPASRS